MAAEYIPAVEENNQNSEIIVDSFGSSPSVYMNYDFTDQSWNDFYNYLFK